MTHRRINLNIHLAAFDQDWNLLEDVAVTDYEFKDSVQTWRPWILLHGSRLYVSYDVVPIEAGTQKELAPCRRMWLCMNSTLDRRLFAAQEASPAAAVSPRQWRPTA
jgi:hypothetical protein